MKSSFDLKAIFQWFLLRTDKTLRGVIEINDDHSEPIFGRAMIAIDELNEQDIESKMKMGLKEVKPKIEEWRNWNSLQFEIAGRVELNYDLLSLFNIDITKAIGVQVYIQVTDLISGQDRIINHIIPIFTHDIRPPQFEVIAKRPDGKPIQMKDIIVTIQMILGNEQGKKQDEKSVGIKDFYKSYVCLNLSKKIYFFIFFSVRNDIYLFNLEIRDNCIGVLITVNIFIFIYFVRSLSLY